MAARMKPSSPANARQIAADILCRWRTTGRFPDRELEGVRQRRPLVMELVYGTIRMHRQLDALRAGLVDRKPAVKIDEVILMGLYQVLYMDRVPDHALVHDTVQAAKHVGGAGAVRLVNAVLRRALRERASLLTAIQSLPLGPRLSHPDLLVKRWSATYGEDAATALCTWNNLRPEVTLYVRPSFDAWFRRAVEDQGVAVEPHPGAPEHYVMLPRGISVMDVPGFTEGAWIAQDPSTRESVRLLDVRPGHLVLDLCAAPGGKTVHLADALQGQGRLIAADRHPDRIRLLEDTLHRTGLHAETRIVRAENPDELRQALGLKSSEFVDRILLDVPCSNTGVLRRRVDARWRFSPDRLAKLCRSQRRLLDAAAPLLRPGGILVYSTCSLEPEENQGQISDWLETHPRMMQTTDHQNLPPNGQMDGTYASRIEFRPAPA